MAGGNGGRKAVEPLYQSQLPDDPSPEEVHRFLRGQERRLEQVARDTDTHTQVLQRVETLATEIKLLIGKDEEGPDGGLVRTGLKGRVGRLEDAVTKRFRRYDDLARFVAGWVAAAAIGIAVVWWIVEVRIEEVLKPDFKAASAERKVDAAEARARP